MSRLVQPVSEGPLDVIGDIHGERDALELLLDKLGYDRHGRHKEDRRLVFVGDFCDRGPDSPGVIRIIRTLIDNGRAQAVAGNHELNLLRGEHKHGNHWFYGISEDHEFGKCIALEKSDQAGILEFFRSLPVALERAELRIVHAAWVEPAISQCRAVSESIDVAYAIFDEALRTSPRFQALEERYKLEIEVLGTSIKDETAAPAAASVGPYDEANQMWNPIRVVTSGVERATTEPFFGAGKWRFVNRVAWWKEYAGHIPVLFGHYWRWWDPSIHEVLSKGEPQLFDDDPVGPFMANDHRAFCVDFSAGSRYKQRRSGHERPYHGRLAAMRWPERELVFDADPPNGVGVLEDLAR